MRLFKNKRNLIYLTGFILIANVFAIAYQLFFVKTKTKDVHKAVMNSVLVKEEEAISGLICDSHVEHDFIYYLFKGYQRGCYFGLDNKDFNIEMRKFIKFGQTSILKKKNDSMVYVIKGTDTMSFIFQIDKQNNVLQRGEKWSLK